MRLYVCLDGQVKLGSRLKDRMNINELCLDILDCPNVKIGL